MTLFLGFSAVNTANNLMYLILSAMLSFMAVSGFFGKRNLSKVEVDLEFPEEIYANREFPLKITLSNNRSFLPVFLMKVRIDGYEAVFPFVDRNKKSARYASAFFKQRGRQGFAQVYVCSAFPFNFFVRSRNLSKTFSFTVFPEPKRYEIPSPLEREDKLKGEMPSVYGGYEADIISVRKYIYGDPLKYINWKATAKTGELRTKELSSLSSQPVVIDFDRTAIRNIEEKLSGITYTVIGLMRKNIPVGLKIRNKLYKPALSGRHKAAILTELALFGNDR